MEMKPHLRFAAVVVCMHTNFQSLLKRSVYGKLNLFTLTARWRLAFAAYAKLKVAPYRFQK